MENTTTPPVTVLPLIPGEFCYRAADRAAGATPPREPRDWSRPTAELEAEREEYWRRVRTAPADVWAEIDEAARDYAIGILSPEYVPAGFIIPEPMTDDHRGRPMYLCVVCRAGRYFAGYRAKDRTAEALP